MTRVIGNLQYTILKTLAESTGLTTGDLARLLNLDKMKVYDAIKGLEKRGLVFSFPYYIEYQGRNKIYRQRTRVYVINEDGKKVLNLPKDYLPKAPLTTRKYITYEEMREWGEQPKAFYRAVKEAWASYKTKAQK
ncbi:MAG: MarR family transcriptional regulator [Nitrososphaerota archaeon]